MWNTWKKMVKQIIQTTTRRHWECRRKTRQEDIGYVGHVDNIEDKVVVDDMEYMDFIDDMEKYGKVYVHQGRYGGHEGNVSKSATGEYK